MQHDKNNHVMPTGTQGLPQLYWLEMFLASVHQARSIGLELPQPVWLSHRYPPCDCDSPWHCRTSKILAKRCSLLDAASFRHLQHGLAGSDAVTKLFALIMAHDACFPVQTGLKKWKLRFWGPPMDIPQCFSPLASPAHHCLKAKQRSFFGTKNPREPATLPSSYRLCGWYRLGPPRMLVVAWILCLVIQGYTTSHGSKPQAPDGGEIVSCPV